MAGDDMVGQAAQDEARIRLARADRRDRDRADRSGDRRVGEQDRIGEVAARGGEQQRAHRERDGAAVGRAQRHGAKIGLGHRRARPGRREQPAGVFELTAHPVERLQRGPLGPGLLERAQRRPGMTGPDLGIGGAEFDLLRPAMAQARVQERGHPRRRRRERQRPFQAKPVARARQDAAPIRQQRIIGDEVSRYPLGQALGIQHMAQPQQDGLFQRHPIADRERAGNGRRVPQGHDRGRVPRPPAPAPAATAGAAATAAGPSARTSGRRRTPAVAPPPSAAARPAASPPAAVPGRTGSNRSRRSARPRGSRRSAASPAPTPKTRLGCRDPAAASGPDQPRRAG